MGGRRIAAALGAVVLAGAAPALLSGSDADAPKAPSAKAGAAARLSPEQVRGAAAARRAAATSRGPLRARLVRRAMLRHRPGGRMLRSIRTRTEFGSARVLAVVERRPGWLGVLTPYANSRTVWIPDTAAELLSERYALQADLSARTLLVRRDGRVVRRIAVAIGRPGTATPTGRFAVTDALVVEDAASPYGCCVLALTGRQPNVPQGWTGGDRLAIHGTTNEGTIGTAASGGCLRAGEDDMRWLIEHVQPGALVRIRA